MDMKELGIWEPLSVKLQTYKTAVEVRKRLWALLLARETAQGLAAAVFSCGKS